MISVIVPVYNVELYLRKCLDSIIEQRYPYLEILIIDDGSTDNSGSICDEYAERDVRIKLFHTENRGLSSARNLGLENATGDYIAFVDSDDWIDVETFEIAKPVAEAQNAELVFWGYVKEYTHHSEEKGFFWDDLYVFEEEQVKYQLHRRLFGLVGEELSHIEYSNAFDTVWGKLYKADVIRDRHIRFEDTSVIGTEDALFNIYFMGYVHKAVHIAKCMSHYRKNNDSLTALFKPSLHMQWKTLFDRMHEYIVDNELPEVFDEALNNRIATSIIGIGLNILTSTETIIQKKRFLGTVIHMDPYNEAIESLNSGLLSFHWKVFFWLIRKDYINGLYLSLCIMKRIVYRRH